MTDERARNLKISERVFLTEHFVHGNVQPRPITVIINNIEIIEHKVILKLETDDQSGKIVASCERVHESVIDAAIWVRNQYDAEIQYLIETEKRVRRNQQVSLDNMTESARERMAVDSR